MYQTKAYLQVFIMTIVLAGLIGCNRKISRKAHQTGGLADACSTLGSRTNGTGTSTEDDTSPFGEGAFLLNPETIDPKKIGKVDAEAIKIGDDVNYQGLFTIPSISIVPTVDMLRGNVETVFVKVTDFQDNDLAYPPNDALYQGYYKPFSGGFRLGCMKDLIGKRVRVNFYPCVHKDNLSTIPTSQHGHGYVCFEGPNHKHSRVLQYGFFTPDYRDLIPESDREKIIEGVCELERAEYEGNISVAQDLKKIANDYFAGTLSGGNKQIKDALRVYKDLNGIGRMVAELEVSVPENLRIFTDVEVTQQESASLALAKTGQRLTSDDCEEDDGFVSSTDTEEDGDFGDFGDFLPSTPSDSFGDEIFENPGEIGSNDTTDGDTTGGDTTDDDTTGDDDDDNSDSEDNDDSTGSEGTEDSDSGSEGPNPVEVESEQQEKEEQNKKKKVLAVSIIVSALAFGAFGASIADHLGLWEDKKVRGQRAQHFKAYNDALDGLRNVTREDLPKRIEAYNSALQERIDFEKSANKNGLDDAKIKELNDYKISTDLEKKAVFGDLSKPKINSAEFKKRNIGTFDPSYRGRKFGKKTGFRAIFGYLAVGVVASSIAYNSANLALTNSKSVEEALIEAGDKKVQLEERLRQLEEEQSEHYLQVRTTIEQTSE